ARSAGLDLLRVHGHVSRPELYAAADRAGLLLWQDLPLQWGYARTVRREAARQAREAVDLLGHHACIAVWCGHNEPFALALEPGAGLQGGARLIARFVAAQELPTYNRTILDASVKRALAVARSRLGPPGPDPRPAAGPLRSLRGPRRARQLSGLEGRHPGLPGRSHPPPRGDPAPAQVPAHGRLLPVLPGRWPSGRELVRPRPPAGAQGRLSRPGRSLRPRDRRRRPPGAGLHAGPAR